MQWTGDEYWKWNGDQKSTLMALPEVVLFLNICINVLSIKVFII